MNKDLKVQKWLHFLPHQSPYTQGGQWMRGALLKFFLNIFFGGNHKLHLFQTLSRVWELPAPCMTSRWAEKAWAWRETGRQWSEDAEGSWRSRLELLGCFFSHNPPLVSSFCLRTWKRPNLGQERHKKTSSGGLTLTSNNGFGTSARKDAGDSSPPLPLAALYRGAFAHFFPADLRGVQLGRGESGCLQRT